VIKSTFFKVWIGFLGGIVFTCNYISLYGINIEYTAAPWKMVAAVLIPFIYVLAYRGD